MKDLSRFDTPKKEPEIKQELKKTSPESKKKKVVIVAIVCLLAIAVGSKLVNKHLKKLKAEEKATIEENTPKEVLKKETSKAEQKPDFEEQKKKNKMIFTFYDHLKNEQVEVDASPQAQRTEYKYTYIYQVASFRNMNETTYYAKKMKEAGLEPQYKTVGSWIRMYIGPYDSKRAIAPDIIKLQRIGLNGGFTREISRTKIEPKSEKDTNKKTEDKSDKKDTKE
ncbi:SPOR domain-containing protein [Francisella adeliensis]|uniref:Cell division protein n=1 Tax=Francisella adeliensis TaxID=2007306 RepID=A0A2Z4Y090_9GAMM|nr:SPOR domain-containing protein [Francisella adeliensis]AXA34318.1 cell division protein [Francisella adeliensis]MBK2084696.1 SPOR domain-containing protein [Francisella adeliensis]MBK2096205.1 SPOR domain-containing protein [Francisella adeliensis]QIW12565.1 SPOR domain-containing protein [Francisella adeliensis]QIW14438.1 SPOR domain-containing protein [Francisella adeliensis]